MRGISYRNDQVASNEPRGSKTARRDAVFDPGGPLSGGVRYQCDSIQPHDIGKMYMGCGRGLMAGVVLKFNSKG